MADYNVNMKQWNGTSFDNVLPLAYNALKVGGKTYDEIVEFVNSLVGIGGYNARIDIGSYRGNGTYGESNPSSLSFNLNPLIVVIASNSASEVGVLGNPVTGGLLYNGYTRSLKVTWSGKTVSWYTTTTSNAKLAQLNSKNTTYYWVALGYDD